MALAGLKIVFLDRDTLSPETRFRPPAFAHSLVMHQNTRPDEVAARIAEADIVISNKVSIRAEAINGAKQLKLIAIAATGTDPVDLAACRAAGVTVCNVRDYAANTVPEHVFALILSLRRSIVAYRQSVIDGRWQQSGRFCFFDHPIADLAGSTLGIFGSGSLGSAVARLGEAFGMRVLRAGRKGAAEAGEGRTPFAEVLAKSDVISLNCPLNAETRGLIGRPEFALMQRRPILINASRGGLVDEEALVEALDAGQIAGAGFDVTLPEPPPADSPLMRIASRPNVVVTPHVAWASREAIQALADQLVENIELFVAGKPRNTV